MSFEKRSMSNNVISAGHRNFVWGGNITQDPPDEISLLIFSHLRPFEVVKNVALVSKQFYNLSCDESLWQHFYYSSSQSKNKNDSTSFKEAYKRFYPALSKKDVSSPVDDRFSVKRLHLESGFLRFEANRLWFFNSTTQLHCSSSIDFLIKKNPPDLSVLILEKPLTQDSFSETYEKWKKLKEKLAAYRDNSSDSEIKDSLCSELNDLSNSAKQMLSPQLNFKFQELQESLGDTDTCSFIDILFRRYSSYMTKIKNAEVRSDSFTNLDSSQNYLLFGDRAGKIFEVFHKNGYRICLFFDLTSGDLPFRINFLGEKLTIYAGLNKTDVLVVDLTTLALSVNKENYSMDMGDVFHKLSNESLLCPSDPYVSILNINSNNEPVEYFLNYDSIYDSCYIPSQSRLVLLVNLDRNILLTALPIRDGELEVDNPLFSIAVDNSISFNRNLKLEGLSILYHNDYILMAHGSRLFRFWMTENAWGTEFEQLELGIEPSKYFANLMSLGDSLIINIENDVYLVDFKTQREEDPFQSLLYGYLTNTEDDTGGMMIDLADTFQSMSEEPLIDSDQGEEGTEPPKKKRRTQETP